MSASLVGSEMCIRDRASRARLRGTLRLWPWRRAAPCRRSRCGFGSSCAPVSYTHLTLPTICSV
eukprot:14730713-Alexandrium_andersonii.AAC.1